MNKTKPPRVPRSANLATTFVAFGITTLIIVGVGITLYRAGHKTSTQPQKLQIVAAENFWGSLVSQIGGSHAVVKSVVSDPNADPHEYESNSADARSFATANYVIENGVGYDSWADKLLSASPNSNRVVLNVGQLVGKQNGDNPHLWYNPDYVNQAINQMEVDLVRLDPADATYYKQQLATLKSKLLPYQDRIQSIKQNYGGEKVAATEDIFAYLASAAGLNLVSPSAFIQAVAEGNDPPSSSIVEFQQQLQSGQVKAMVYNEQTVTPLTNSMKKIATDQDIPIVGVTETIQPPNTTFQDWMNSQLIDLQNALNARTLGQ
jgi:zinc/manganese transport system substrate-binding protein